MNAHTPRRDLQADAAPLDGPAPKREEDAVAFLQWKLNRIAELARSGSIIIEHQLGRDAPAAMLDAIFSAIEDDASEADALVSRTNAHG